jgi:hypothetical protein
LEIFQRLAERAPTGPVGAKALSNETKAKPWSVREDNGQFTVYAPKNIEAFCDDFLTLAGVTAALRIPGVTILPSLEESDVKSIIETKSTQLYFSGVAAALKLPTIKSFPDYSGSFGRGFNFVVHQKLEDTKVSVKLLKGATETLQHAASGKAWASNTTADQQRIFALIRRASRMITVENHGLWLRSWRSLQGQEVKKTIKHLKVGILSKVESDYIVQLHPKGPELYEILQRKIVEADLNIMVNLPNMIDEANKALSIPERIADTVVRLRLSRILPSQGKARKNALSRPMAELIDEMDGEAFIETFNPALVTRATMFKLNLDRFTGTSASPEEIKRILVEDYKKYLTTIEDDSYRSYCCNWFESALNARLNY